jgi:hypothetical protein
MHVGLRQHACIRVAVWGVGGGGNGGGCVGSDITFINVRLSGSTCHLTRFSNPTALAGEGRGNQPQGPARLQPSLYLERPFPRKLS